MAPVARLEYKEGYLSNPIIAKLACKKLNLLPEELEKIVGRYVKGKRKGMLKGKLTWKYCTSGGWHWIEFDHGFVAYPHQSYYFGIVDAWTNEEIIKPQVYSSELKVDETEVRELEEEISRLKVELPVQEKALELLKKNEFTGKDIILKKADELIELTKALLSGKENELLGLNQLKEKYNKINALQEVK